MQTEQLSTDMFNSESQYNSWYEHHEEDLYFTDSARQTLEPHEQFKRY